MKKFIAMMLCLVLALGCCSAFAATASDESDKVSIKVKKYVLAVTSTDDLIFYDESGAGNTVIEVSNGTGDRVISTKVTLSAEGYADSTTSVASSNGKVTISADDIKAFVGKGKIAVVTITTSFSYVTKNNIISAATDINEVQVLVMDESSIVTDGLIFATTNLDSGEAFPGDMFVFTGSLDYSALVTKLGGRANVTVNTVKVYTTNGGDSEGILNGTGENFTTQDNVATTKSITYYVPSVAENTIIQFWTIGTITITE